MASAGERKGLLVFTSPESPELSELKNLPPDFEVVATGKTEAELSGLSQQQWGSIEVVLRCGIQDRKGMGSELQKIWPKMPNLRWLHSHEAGLEGILFPELVESPIIFTNGKGSYSHSLAEWALAACSWFAKQLPLLKANQSAGTWEKFNVQELRGKTMGIIGYGSIGQACASIARAYRMDIIALRRRPERSAEEQGLKVYTPDRLHQLMSESHYVVAALPSTPETKGYINAEAIASMRSDAVFINVGRGKTVDEKALIQALQERRIKGAGLDVFATEPLPSESPLWKLDNVLMSPHSADWTDTFQHEAVEQFVTFAEQYLAGQELPNQPDRKAGY